MRPRAIAVVAVIAYAIFLVALLPASFVTERITAATGGRVSFGNAGGTLWNGSARMGFTVAGGWLNLDSVQWSFNPSSLLIGKISFDLNANGAPDLEARATVSRGFGGWSVDRAGLVGSVASIATLAPIAARWRPEGRLAVQVSDWLWSGQGMRGEASIDWMKAAVSLSDVKPIGSYRVRVVGDGSNVARLTATTSAGPLQVSGSGAAGPAEIRFSGEARAADPAAAKALEQLLDLMGPRRPDGARALELRIAF